MAQARASIMFQSTHPRRVWQITIRRFVVHNCFNPHTHAGCDLWMLSVPLLLKRFNPHTHAGCDNFQVYAVQNLDSFNPHTHAGCDHYHLLLFTNSKVSIHTPTQGVTVSADTMQYAMYVSIHTPTQGVTENPRLSESAKVFQSTHPRRVWPYI